MPEPKFTPGPWKADVRVGCVAVYPASEEVNCISSIKKRLAYFKGYKTNTKDNLYEWNVDPEDVANAHLISAAPDMYELLKEITPPANVNGWWCPECKREVDGSEVTYQEYHETCGTYLGEVNNEEWIKKARQILAKAEGKEA